MSETSHTAFFGDAEHVFDLAKPELVRELEALTGSGIGAIIRRVVETRTFTHADLEAVIRLGMIGGGTDPKTAARLVAAYLPTRPLAEAMVLAVSILEAVFIGGGNQAAPAVPVEEPPASEPIPEPEPLPVDNDVLERRRRDAHTRWTTMQPEVVS